MIKPRFKVNTVAIMAIMILIIISCHKDDKVNPCADVTPTKADFKIEETHWAAVAVDGVFDYETDTIRLGEARFTVTTEADSVKWLIGAGVYRDKSIVIAFDYLDNKSIPITLIVFRSPRTDCFPNDKSSDTLTKMMYIDRTNSKVFGKYTGYWKEAPNDIFTLQLLNDTVYIDPWNTAPYKLINFDKQNCIAGVTGFWGYRKAWIMNNYDGCSGTCGGGGYGILTLDETGNKVDITYYTRKYQGPILVNVHHEFIGTRVP